MKLLICLFLVLYLTITGWKQGFLVVRHKIAVSFIGRRDQNSFGANVCACTGFTKRGLVLEEGKKYNFTFDGSVTNGIITIEITHKGKLVLVLSESKTKGELYAQKGIYTITTRFKNTDGDYNLIWKQE